MKRLYERVLSEHYKKNRQMLFVMGARQVGKTTLGVALKEDVERGEYLTWDNEEHRQLIKGGVEAVARHFHIGAKDYPVPLIVFDEIHKYRQWKNFLKGLYDTYPFMSQIMVMGSARLDVYQKGADSLMGRYFRYRVHPLTIRELCEPEIIPGSVRPEPIKVPDSHFDALWEFGGFPEPLLKSDANYSNQWQTLRRVQLFRGDLSDLAQVREVEQIELLAEYIRGSVGSQVSYTSLSKKVGVAHTTVRKWIGWLNALYYCFGLHPWSKSVPRSLIKEPKYYMTDWSTVQDPASRAENFVASHLLKAVHFWTDYGTARFGLYYIRDRDKREVDFVVTRDEQPWLLVEVKLNDRFKLSPSLVHFQKELNVPYAIQAVFGMPETNEPCFLDNQPRIVSARSFLSQLV